jgi:FemAB-related protein (PEP-CTERM system-associated)
VNAHQDILRPSVGTAKLDDPATFSRIRDFVLAQPGATPFHLPEWSSAVEAGCGQRSHYLLAEDGAGRISAVLPLSEVRSALFGSALVSSAFAVGGGVLGDESAVEPLAQAALELAGSVGCADLELRGGPVPSGFAVREGVYANFARPLDSDGEAILKAIPRKQRAEVRRALGYGMQVSVGSDDKDRRDHYRVYAQSVHNLGTPVFPRTLFDAMLDAFGNAADILTVYHEGEPVASALSLYMNGTCYPYWGGGTQDARKLRANELMHYEIMRHAAARGCTRFDFGRSKVGTGAYAYKTYWGFEPEPLRYGVRNLAGGAPREINPLSPKYRLQVAMWKRLPLPIANRLGPMIARGLG